MKKLYVLAWVVLFMVCCIATSGFAKAKQNVADHAARETITDTTQKQEENVQNVSDSDIQMEDAGINGIKDNELVKGKKSHGTKAASPKNVLLDTVTVTAQKTEENIQDVPISMSVFDAFSLEDKSIDTVEDIGKYTPGLQIMSGAALKAAPSMRGLYSNYTTRSSVAGLFVDGIPITRGTGFDETLLDVERVEVLKGPQGTLYGKNTEVGAVSVITKKPDNETRGKVKGTLGSDGKQEYIFNISGPVVKDKFYIGVAGKHYEKDGYIKNINTGEDEDDREHNYGKINLRYTPTDNLEFSLISSRIKYNDGGTAIGTKKTNEREVTSDFETFNHSDVFMSSLNVTYHFNQKVSLSSISSHREHKEEKSDDFDYTDNYAKKYHVVNDNNYKTFSQELRINYEADTIKLVAGLFYDTADIDYNKNIDKWNSSSIKLQNLDSDSLGIFSHLTYNINDKLSILGGLRFDNDKQTYKDSTQTIEYDKNEISPKVGLTYDLSKDMMSYVTIAKGYRSGGFNIFAPADYSKTFDTETLYSYEIGFKGTSLDNRLFFDIAFYYMDINDMQVDEYVEASTVIKTNAAKATSKGIEASLNFRASDNITLFAGASYNDIKFDKYHNGYTDYSGNRTGMAPKYDFNIGATYRADSGYYASADITGFGKTYLDSANEYTQDAYELVNAKIGYEQKNYDIYLYAKNLFDEKYDSNGSYSGTYYSYSPPREIGVQLSYRF